LSCLELGGGGVLVFRLVGLLEDLDKSEKRGRFMGVKKRWARFVVVGLVILFFGTLIGIWVMAGSMASPGE